MENDLSLPELNFPCEYPVRVIGKDEDHFFEFVFEVITRHVPGLAIEDFHSNPSRGGKYVSVSVTFIAESRAQVDALYQELGSHKRILVAM